MEHSDQRAILIKKDDIIMVVLSLPGLEFTWRGESGVAPRLEQYCLPPSGRHCVCLFRLVLISSSFTNMLCWGNAKDGQLGIGVERNPVFEPRNSHVFSGRGLNEVACGGQHSLFLLHDGSVYTCGSNSCGQLGHNKAGTSPGKLSVWTPSPMTFAKLTSGNYGPLQSCLGISSFVKSWH